MPPAAEVDQIDKYLPFLVEIRRRLLFLLSLFLVTTTLGFIYYERIIKFVLGIFKLKGVNIVFTSPFQFFSLAINSAILVGIIVVFPLIIIQVLSFLKPALTKKEYRLIVLLLPLCLILFVLGFAFGVYVMKYVLAIFYQKSVELNIGNLLDIELLLSKIVLTAILMGIMFQFPIVMTILMRLKIINFKFFISQRPVAYLIGLIFVLLLPPTDLLSDALLFLPLVLLFEFTLILNKLVLKSHLL